MASPYIISTLLAFLALIAFEKKHSITSSLLYFGASLAKEIAVPLPLVLLILPNGDLRDRVRRTAPHFVAAAVYLLWRRMMLGTFFGGYGWAPRIGELVIALPRKLWSTIAGPDVWLASAFLLFTGALIVAQFCNLSFLWRATVALILSIAPIVPVSRDMQTRWAFAAWICWVALFIAAVTLAQISDALRASACIVAAVLAMAVNRTEWQMDFGKARRMSDEARLFMRLGRNDLVRSPETPASAMNEFRWMKQHLLHEPSGGWFYDDFYICTGRAAARTIRPAAPNASQFCASIRSRAPLNAQFQYDGKVLSWSLGPYSDGTWRFVFDDGAEAYDVPGSDAFQIGSVQTMALRIRYSSPAGWITYSPNLVLDLAHQRDIAWHR
jgi:hypothetical protein